MYDAIVIGSGFGGAVTAAKLTRNGRDVLLLEKGHRWRRPKPNDPGENIHLGAPLSNLVDERGHPKAAGDADRYGNPNYVLRQSTDLKYIFFESPRTGIRSGGVRDHIGDRGGDGGPRHGAGSLVYSQVNSAVETFARLEGAAVRPRHAGSYYERVSGCADVRQTWEDAEAGRDRRRHGERGSGTKPARLGNFRIARAPTADAPVMNPWGRPVSPATGAGSAPSAASSTPPDLTLNYLAVAGTPASGGDGRPPSPSEDPARLPGLTGRARAAPRGPIGMRRGWSSWWGAISSQAALLPRPGLAGRRVTASTARLGQQRRHLRRCPQPADDLKAEVSRGTSFARVLPLVAVQEVYPRGHRHGPLGAAKFPLRREATTGATGARAEGADARSLRDEHRGPGRKGIDAEGRVTLDRKGRPSSTGRDRLFRPPRVRAIEGIRAACRMVAEAGGGELLHEKEWSDDRRMLGVHPLGGCRMATHAGAGVVDARGTVFGYPGLYVVDGSIMPSAIGVNPSLTIAAVAEKLSDGILEWLEGAHPRRAAAGT
jgi:choline dehydrogenase-like flavoprotein